MKTSEASEILEVSLSSSEKPFSHGPEKSHGPTGGDSSSGLSVEIHRLTLARRRERETINLSG